MHAPQVRTVVWEDGMFITQARLEWSWFHVHPQWQEAIRLYIGHADVVKVQATLRSVVGHPRVLTHAPASERVLASLDADGMPAATCAYERALSKYDDYTDTAELGGRFYRFYSACEAFAAEPGTPFVFVSVFSPDAPSSATKFAEVHSWIRFVVNMKHETAPCVGAGSVWVYGDQLQRFAPGYNTTSLLTASNKTSRAVSNFILSRTRSLLKSKASMYVW